ncbi:sulfurtransferase TusA family protein [Nocardioides sp.]|uniref:sulfurtransferase TusA family protein n=1 Tax=Nocardioides sp. TaxID=35761 RepID=UPI00286B44EB|nr:sulfurtransferase TusA family protein [Nocardioides sp.]
MTGTPEEVDPEEVDPQDVDPQDVALELDCRALMCPLPIIELARHVGDVAVGDVIAVVATDVAARHDVPAWCRMRGHDFLGEDSAADGAPRFRVRRVA